jgi:putative ABC transport system ATP-binding protein
MIEIRQVKKNYRMGETEVPALRGVDLRVEQGEFLAVWGPSGSGKTTLLNLIGAIDEPTSGQVFLGGKDVANLSDNKRSALRNETLGFIFQGFNLVPVLTALENVMLPLHIRGVSARKAREMALNRLAAVQLDKFAQHRPDKLSGGQQQRVSIARALVGNPSVVIADEPTANLDSDTAMAIIALMHDLNRKEQTTFLFSTHDDRLLGQVERLIRLEDGKIVSGGDHAALD